MLTVTAIHEVPPTNTAPGMMPAATKTEVTLEMGADVIRRETSIVSACTALRTAVKFAFPGVGLPGQPPLRQAELVGIATIDSGTAFRLTIHLPYDLGTALRHLADWDDTSCREAFAAVS